MTLSLTGAPELLQVPWEYMYDHPSFLSISAWTPIVRYLDLPKPRRPLQLDLPLRILGHGQRPTDAELIDAKQERAEARGGTRAAHQDAARSRSIGCRRRACVPCSASSGKADYHVFHFIGHGGYDHVADDGVLLFEDDGRARSTGQRHPAGRRSSPTRCRCAWPCLNSCEGARSSLQDPFSGVATSLIEREIPAVIGMQFEITDRAAIVFAGEFYSALADGLPVDSSVAEARKAIYADRERHRMGHAGAVHAGRRRTLVRRRAARAAQAGRPDDP